MSRGFNLLRIAYAGFSAIASILCIIFLLVEILCRVKLPLSLVAVASFPIRAYLDVLYFTHLRITVDWRSRYYWSLSFWDAPKSKTILSQMPFSIPLYMIVVDLTIIAIVPALFVALPRGLRLFAIGVPVLMDLGYLCRVSMQVFFQFQWLLTTLEYRRGNRLHRTPSTLMLEFLSSSLHINLAPALYSFTLGLIAWLFLGLLLVFIDFLKGDQLRSFERAGFIVLIVLIIIPVILTGASLSLYLLSRILQDMARQAILIFGRNGSISQRRRDDHLGVDIILRWRGVAEVRLDTVWLVAGMLIVDTSVIFIGLLVWSIKKLH
ncbi:hypothetical protein F4777DRAFT_564691 [Nemania sp. FL0916]|nr:hypothetical protein F4777DRAFT_564691 [Nemania sp. FL0916]